MEIWQMILTMLGGVAVFVLAVILLIRIFQSFVLTRILALGFAIASVVMAFPLSNMYKESWTNPSGNSAPLLIATTLCTVVAWICFVGPGVFEVEWDGEFDIVEGLFGQIDIEPHEFSWLFLHIAIAAPVSFVTYFLLAPEMVWLFFALPILVIAITVIGFFISLSNA